MAAMAAADFSPHHVMLVGAQTAHYDYSPQMMGMHHALTPPHAQMHAASFGIGGVPWQAGGHYAYAQHQQPVDHSPAPNRFDPVSAFMQQLGIDASEEHLLGWIAELGLQSPLPARWESCTDLGTGCTYYVDQERQSSSWEHPLLPHLTRIVDLGKEYIYGRQEGFFEEAKRRLWQEQRDELAMWHGPFESFNGKQYFVNSATGSTSSRDPRDDAQYVYELQSNFLYNLEEVLDSVSEQQPGTPGGHWRDQDGAEVWQADGGAQVLSLDDSGAANQSSSTNGRFQRATTMRLAAIARVDHKSMFQTMKQTADKVQTACLEEEEAQRMKLSRLVEARRRRKLRRRDVSPPPLRAMALSCEQPAAQSAAAAVEASGSPSSMSGRRAPASLELEPEIDHGVSYSAGRVAVPVPPPMGPPSPANLVRPPASSPPPPLDGEGEPPLLPPVMSPSEGLRRLAPGKEWRAEAFLASAIASRPGPTGSADVR